MQKVAEPSRRSGAVTEYLAQARWHTKQVPKRIEPRGPSSSPNCNNSGSNRSDEKWNQPSCTAIGRPGRGGKKGVVNRLADCARERIRGPWAGPVDMPPERSTTVDLAWAIDSEPVSQPQILGEAVSPYAPATQRCEQVPVPVPARRSTAACPVGGHWPVWCVALAIQLVTRVKLSLRSTPKALEVVFDFLRGRTVTTTMMAWTTVRCWLMRLGLSALLRPLEQANDWAYLIDHTVQIGTVKCFAVVGVRLSQLPYPRRCLQREDLVLIALTPMQQSNAVTVKQALEEAELRTGVPRLIVSDEGGDVTGRHRAVLRRSSPHILDLRYGSQGGKPAAQAPGRGRAVARVVAQLGQTKGKLQQTALACCVGPSLRPKARFMNLGAPLRWARWCLRVLDQPWPTSPALSDRQRAVLTKIDCEQLEAKLGWLRDYREAIEQWSQWHEVIQVVVRQVRRCGIGKDSVETLGDRQIEFTCDTVLCGLRHAGNPNRSTQTGKCYQTAFYEANWPLLSQLCVDLFGSGVSFDLPLALRHRLEAMKLSPSGRDTANVMLIFVRLHATAVRRPGELLIASTEILESLFGELKTLERQQAGSGLTGLMLALGAIVSAWTDEETTKALEATPWKAVQAWIDERLGPTVQSERRTLQAIFTET